MASTRAAAANDFIARGKSAPACSHLMNAYRKVDGSAPDFAGGPAAAAQQAEDAEPIRDQLVGP